jgi:hypothetical protein
MDQPNPTIGIVIVSYNTRALLRDCLQSLQPVTLSRRILVIDNASRDDSVSMVRTDFPDVEICALEENRGFAAANNLGLGMLGFAPPSPGAAGITPPEFVLLLNPDTVVLPGALETLTAFLQAHPRVGLVSPRLRNPDGTTQPAAFRFPTLTMSLLEVFPPGEVLPGRLYNSWWHGRYPQEQNGTEPFPIDHPLGACMLVRGCTIAQVGLLDENYFMYSEEIEWCWRIRQAGWAIWQQPHAQVVHVGGAATQQFRRQMLIELYRSRIRFFQQHYRPGFLRLHRWITRLGMLRATLCAWYAYRRHRIGRDELRARLWAYGAITRL